MSVVKFSLHASYVMILGRISLEECFGIRTLDFLNKIYVPLLLLDFLIEVRRVLTHVIMFSYTNRTLETHFKYGQFRRIMCCFQRKVKPMVRFQLYSCEF